MTIWHMCKACWIPEATNTHSDYVIFIAFPLQQSLHKHASLLCYRYITCLVSLLQMVCPGGLFNTGENPESLWVILVLLK